MLINYQKLINLPVITQSGINLGKISKIEIDTKSQSIINYYVKSINLVKGLLEGELVINRNQVININEKNVIVDDNCSAKIQKKEFFNLKTANHIQSPGAIKTVNSIKIEKIEN